MSYTDTIRLLQAASAEIDAELMPNLSGRQRYAAAMVKRSVDLAARELAAEPGVIDRALIQDVYPDAASRSRADLAADIRARRIETPLLDALFADVCRRLQIDNPRFLDRQS